MKRHPYIDLWLVLAVSLIVIAGISISDLHIQIGSYFVKKAPFRESLLSDKSPQGASGGSLLLTDGGPGQGDEAGETVEVDQSPQTFLIFGDSMTPNLARRLADYAGHNGHTSVHSVNWDSSTSITWAESDKIEHFIEQYKPTFIIVCLGSNESFLRNPSDRVEVIKRIISKFNGLPFIWIGPPRFGQQDAYNDMLTEMLSDRYYFRSDGLELERGKDNIHPVQSGSNKWMDAVMEWIPRSAHPFLAERPAADVVRAKITFDSFGPPRRDNGDEKNSEESEGSESSESTEPTESSESTETPVKTPEPITLPDSI
ncbi:MAG: hypothetical protein K2K82_09140 [Muribaculaceae bacterium]|nr:hypothetical protein [Muribaculaceae bacterium]